MSSSKALREPACKRCHQRKSRCDKARPSCGQCLRTRNSCSYEEKVGPIRREEFERLKEQLKRSESDNAALKERLHLSENSVGSNGTTNRSMESPHSSLDNTQSDGYVAEHVSHLSLNAGGNQSFLGSTSGLLLANLLETNLAESQSPGSGVKVRPSPLNIEQRNDLVQVDIAVPPKQLALSLFAAYQDHDHLAYPFLDLRQISRTIESAYADASYRSKNPTEIFFLDMVCAIATAYVHKFDWQSLPDAETHYKRAMFSFNAVLAQGGLVALQGILAVCQYRMGSSSQDVSSNLWLMIGIAARMCFELGLHRESVYVTETAALPGDRTSTKRCCFWSVVAMDRVASVLLGRPLAIRLEDTDVEFPVSNLSVNLDSPSASLDPLKELRIPIFAHIVKYRVICGDIMTGLHNPGKRQNGDAEGTRTSLAGALHSWKQDLDQLALLHLTVSPSSTANISSFRAREWYELLYHNGILMLYRPSQDVSDISVNDETLWHVFNSAREAIHGYASLHRNRKINYSWVTLHAVFIAGLSYVYAIRCHFQNTRIVGDTHPRSKLAVTPSIAQVVNDTRACSNVLVAVSERWNSARGCSQAFERLSDAVLADVIEAETSNMTADGTRNVDQTMQDFCGDLRDIWSDQYGNDAIFQLSQDWIFSIPELT